MEQKLPTFKSGTTYQKLIYVIAVLFALVSLYFGIVTQASIYQQVVHLTFSITLILLLYQTKNNFIKIIDLIILGMGLISGFYLLFNYDQIIFRVGNLTNFDIVIGGMTIIVVLYATKKVIGWSLPVLSLILLLYAFFGRYLPGYFQHGGYDITRVISHLNLTEDGIFGSPLRASATLVIFFLIFSSFFERAGGGHLVIQLANTLFGWMKGGPAKVAVVASSLFGSISGSAVANVAGTGALTIPLMKKSGYKPHFAGAVEAVASTGGQLMPPIMGAAAFIMAEILGVPYLDIVIAAIIPAILYYLAVFTMVHLEAKRLGLKGMKRSELPSVKKLLLEYGHMLIPLAILVFMLVYLRTSPAKAALISVGVTIVVSFFRKITRMSLQDIFESLAKSSTGVLQVALATACAGIIVGVFALTGLGLKISHILIDASGGSIILLLVLTAITSILLGMGMPTVGAYLVLAILIAPVLIEAGINPIAAHLFIFYFGNLSNVTPPVALAAFAAAGLAGSNPTKTGITATRLAISGFILPFMFIYGNGLLLQGGTFEIVSTTLTSFFGIFLLSIALANFLYVNLKIWERLILIIAAVTLIDHGLITDIIGIVLGCIIIFYNYIRYSRTKDKIQKAS